MISNAHIQETPRAPLIFPASADVLDALPDYEFAFEGAAGLGDEGCTAGGTAADWAAYYHTDATRELNARFGDLRYRIQDLEV